jgi:hypothetical protein
MTAGFKLRGYMVGGEWHVREADCRRAVSDALRTGKEALITSHDALIDALQDLVCDLREREEDGERWNPGTMNVIERAEAVLAKASRAN